MSIKEYSREPVRGDEVTRVQDRIVEFAQQLSDSEGSGARLLEDIDLTYGVENLIEHGKGSDVVGWRIVDIDTAAHVYRVTSTSADPDLFLSLATTATCTVSIEVF